MSTPNNPSQSDLCQICKSPIPAQAKASANRKFCPTCYAHITKTGIQDAMRVRGNMDAKQAEAALNEQDLRGLACGLATSEDFADIFDMSDVSGVAARMYAKTGFSNPERKSEVLNLLTKWALDMQGTAAEMGYRRCNECLTAFKKEDRIEISITEDERELLGLKKPELVICNTDYDQITKKREALAQEKSASNISKIDFNNLSLSQAVLLGGLNPYETPGWITANPSCWRFIHPEQEKKYIGKLQNNGITFMGNAIIHGESAV